MKDNVYVESERRLEVGKRLEPKDQLGYFGHRVLTADKSQEKEHGEEKAELRVEGEGSERESRILPGCAHGLWHQ